jgi:hypothetical protein
MRVCVIDCGFNLGFGVLGRDYVRSGTYRLEGQWDRMDLAFRSMAKIVERIAEKHQPTVIGACIPFVSFKANPINLIPIMGFYARLQEIAADLDLPFHSIHESDARKAFLAPAPVPRKSKDIKAAVKAACDLRGWPATDGHAADALCVADFALAQLDRDAGWYRTPLGRKLRIKSLA